MELHARLLDKSIFRLPRECAIPAAPYGNAPQTAGKAWLRTLAADIPD